MANVGILMMSVWGGKCVRVYMCFSVCLHECVILCLGTVYFCEILKRFAPCAATPCLTFSPYDTFTQTLLMVWYLVALELCFCDSHPWLSRSMSCNSCCVPAKMVVQRCFSDFDLCDY